MTDFPRFPRISSEKKTEVCEKILPPLLSKKLPLKSMRVLARKNMPNYLYEFSDKAYCTACSNIVPRPVKFDKHKSERFCPRCHKKVSVLRGSICSKNFIDEKFVVYPHFIDKGIVYRYFKYQVQYILENETVSVFDLLTEVAREVVMPNFLARFENYYSCGEFFLIGNGECGHYFREYNMYYCGDNKNFCKYAIMYNEKEVRNYLCSISLKEARVEKTSSDFLSCAIEGIIFNNELYEKLNKLGLSDLYNSVPRKNAKGSITKNLLCNKEELRFIIRNKSECYKAYLFLKHKSVRGLSPVIRDKVYSLLNGFADDERVEFFSKSTDKKANYMKKHNISVYTYFNYIDICKKLNLELNNSILYPKDFSKQNNIVHEMYEQRMEMIRAEEQKKQVEEQKKKNATFSSSISEIAKAMYDSEDIRNFMKKSKSSGLLVKIPESVDELIQEGARLHNCLGTYPSRVAKGYCKIFFVRRIEEPDSAFYAFEYKDGEIVQLRTFNNTSDENYDVVWSFASDFVKVLKKFEEKSKVA